MENHYIIKTSLGICPFTPSISPSEHFTTFEGDSVKFKSLYFSGTKREVLDQLVRYVCGAFVLEDAISDLIYSNKEAEITRDEFKVVRTFPFQSAANLS